MLIKRILIVFFRDKSNVFFSLLSVLIIIGLYILFLGGMMENALSLQLGMESDRIGVAVSGIMLGGMVAVTSVSSCMGAMGISIADRERASKDFLTSPISRKKITLGYIIGSSIIGLVMSSVALTLCLIYMASRGGELPGFAEFGMLFITTILSVLCANSMVFLLTAFSKSREAFSAFSSVIGALIGFIMGVYIPIGQLPDSVQWLIRIFPMSHAASMYRQLLADHELQNLFANAPAEALYGLREFFGVVFVFGDYTSSFWMSALWLMLSTIVFFAASVVVMSRRRA